MPDARVSRRPPLAPGARFTVAAMIAPARVAAYDILRRVSTGRADLPAAVAQRRATRSTDERDRALATEIATGVQRWQRALDHLIAALREAAGRRGSIPKSSTSSASAPTSCCT